MGSFIQYPWDLEERVEDAFVALLKQSVGNAMIIPARSVVVAKYPLVVVDAGESNNEKEEANFNGQRRFNVTVAISTEAVNYSEEHSQLELAATARETHRIFKAQVIGALASDALHTELNALGTQGVTFSQAHMTAQTRNGAENKYITEQTLDVIACPKEI